MNIATQLMTLEDYLNDTDETDTRRELEDGELLIIPPESDRNQRIASFLFAYFLQLGIPFDRVRIGTEIAVSGTRATLRLPDLMVLSEELAGALKEASRSTVILDRPPPELVVEVVSPGKANEDRDYRYKRSQYQARGIEEYWIVDPMRQCLIVLSLVEGLYDEAIFEKENEITSRLLKEWGQKEALTVTQLLHQ